MRVVELRRPTDAAQVSAAGRLPIARARRGTRSHARHAASAARISSSRTAVSGSGTPLPVVPGHEAAGVVDAVGGVNVGGDAGDQVALYYITTPPGDPWAAAGVPEPEPQRPAGWELTSTVRSPSSFCGRSRRLCRPPAAIDPAALAVLTDAVATPLHALRARRSVQAGETVAVIGIGGLGSNAVQVARALRCPRDRGLAIGRETRARRPARSRPVRRGRAGSTVESRPSSR